MKTISIVLLSMALTACGGGGDDVPYVSKYARYNGSYTCKVEMTTPMYFQVKGEFEDTRATLTMGGAKYVYDDVFAEVRGGHPRYSEKFGDYDKYETVTFGYKDEMVIYRGPSSNLDYYYTDEFFLCTKDR